MRISDWSSDVCSSDLRIVRQFQIDRAAAKAKSVAEKIAAKVNKGTDLSKALNESGLKLPSTQAVSAKRAEIARGDQRVPPPLAQIGRASCRERVCQYV